MSKLGRTIQIPARTQGREAGVGGGEWLLVCFRLKMPLLGQKSHHSSVPQTHPHMLVTFRGLEFNQYPYQVAHNCLHLQLQMI